MEKPHFPGTQRGEAHKKMLQVLYENLGSKVSGDDLFRAGNERFNYARRLRELKEDGWDLEYEGGGKEGKGWYTLYPPFPSGERSDRIRTAVRMRVLIKDNFSCQLCGNNRHTDPSIVLQVDHCIPFALSKNNSEENLQILCLECNLGKKAQCRDCVHKECLTCKLAFPKKNK
ncbi:HNH endonuclease [Heliobacterium chlorum]|uniref:HNH endonuclease n=1 Tax=Heliobacterium chlorum TaxID=2698 RepID=A0ABR7T427_HELCL|nr:HNH endonuclease [Heliobacterium chlorum]MBC9785522.1 HNH endonuclease [Heliobacterium chlorum]